MAGRRLYTVPGDFDVLELWDAVDAQRVARNMTWNRVATTFACMSPDTIKRMRERGSATCNHVLPMIQWVGRTPESFTVDPDGGVHELLPDPGAGKWRWWWAHLDLAAEVDSKRQEREMSWKEAAAEMGVGAVTNVRDLGKLRYGTSIGIAMICARWVGRSAASFMTTTSPAQVRQQLKG